MNKVIEEKHYDQKYSSSIKKWKYDQLFRSAHNEFMSLVHETIIENEFIKILDLGCGDGHRTIEFLQYNNIAFTGIDISNEGIKKANKNKMGNSVYMVMDAEKLNFKSNSFDLIINYGSFSSLNMLVVWPQLLKVLKPEGSIIGIETIGDNPIFSLKRKINYWRRLRSPVIINNIIKLKTLNLWASSFKNYRNKTFGLISIIWAPIIALLPQNKFPEKLIAISDRLDKYLLGSPTMQTLSFKSVFEYKSLQK